MIHTVAAVFLTGFCVKTMAEDTVISDISVRQRWPWSRKVDIDYLLTAEPGNRYDVSVTVRNGTQILDFPAASMSGDIYSVSQGQRRIVLDPMITIYTNDTLTKFNVFLNPQPTPLYMIVDLTEDAGAANQIEYVYEADLTNGLLGAWVRNPITNQYSGEVVESVVWTGVATNEIYKTEKLVLRRIHAGTFAMGDSVPPTTIVSF